MISNMRLGTKTDSNQPKALVASVFQEGHSFTTLKTGLENFAIKEGEEMLDGIEEGGSILSGAVRMLRDRGIEVVPSLSAVAAPGGPVKDGAFAYVVDRILRSLDAVAPDQVLLALHGAMITESEDDPDGLLVDLLRQRLGPSVPIVVAMDLHADPTNRLFENASLALACKKNPHTDFSEAGARAARLLGKMICGDCRPTTAVVTVPLLVGANMETAFGPLRELHDLRCDEEAGDPSVLDISIFNTTAYIDTVGAGQTVSVTTDDDARLAIRLAEKLAAKLWSLRREFSPDRPALEEVLEERHVTKGESHVPLVIGDQGDRVLAGAPGDDTFVCRTVLEAYPNFRVLAPVTDSETVELAHKLGVAGTFSGAVGAKHSLGAQPLVASFTVLAIGDSGFRQQGPFLAGEFASHGKWAVLTTKNATLVVTEKPAMSQDPAMFLNSGQDPSKFDLVVTKSGFHFKPAFERYGKCIVADTFGLTNYRPGLFPYCKRRPVYPEDDIEAFEFKVRVFPPKRCVSSGE